MSKVIVYPPTSMITLGPCGEDGPQSASSSERVRELVTANDVQSPPLNVTPEEPKKGLRYAAVDVPSGGEGQNGFESGH